MPSAGPRTDSAYVNIGTSAFVQRALTRDPGYVPRQLTGIILDDGETTVYTVEGNVNGAGTALEWLQRGARHRRTSCRCCRNGSMRRASRRCSSTASPVSAARSGSPISARASSATGEPWQQAVAVVESIAFLLQANIDEMAKYLPPAARIRVSGGVSRMDGLCRRLAAVSGLPVHRRDDPEATARGIGYLAAGRPAQWNIETEEQVFAPADEPALRARYRRWRALMAEATGVWLEPSSAREANAAPHLAFVGRPGIVRAHDMVQLRFLTSLILFPVPRRPRA